MSREEAYVLDTSVIVRWFLAQSGWEHARKVRDQFLAGDVTVETVECARFETPWVLRKRGLLPGHLTIDEYLAGCRGIDDLGVFVAPTDVDTIEQAAFLCTTRSIDFFDAIFVARALHSGRPVLTADARLARGVGDLVPVVVLDGVA